MTILFWCYYTVMAASARRNYTVIPMLFRVIRQSFAETC